MTTAGIWVAQGDAAGYFNVHRADNGKKLWSLFWFLSVEQSASDASRSARAYYSSCVFSGVTSDRRESPSDGARDRSGSSARRSRAILNTPSNKIKHRPSSVTMTRQRRTTTRSRVFMSMDCTMSRIIFAWVAPHSLTTLAQPRVRAAKCLGFRQRTAGKVC
jgi:hypothetical protein